MPRVSPFFLVWTLLGFIAVWTVFIGIGRVKYYSAARHESTEFAPKVAGALKDEKFDEALRIADRYKSSHLAQVVEAGLQEFRALQTSQEPPANKLEEIRNALDRARPVVHAKFFDGIPELQIVMGAAPLIGVFGALVFLIEAMKSYSGGVIDLRGLAGGIARCATPLAAGIVVTMFAFGLSEVFSASLRGFDLESQNTASELMEFFAKQMAY